MELCEFTHPSHAGHKLKFESGETLFTCSWCYEAGLFGRYKCDEPNSSCDFHVHKECVSLEPTITHPCFPRSIFELLKSSKRGRYCNACGRMIKGWAYHCPDKGLNLHVTCAALPNTIVEGDLTLEIHNQRKMRSKCYKCGRKRLKGKHNTLFYMSTCEERLHLHVACAKDMVLEKWESSNLGRPDRQQVSGDAGDRGGSPGEGGGGGGGPGGGSSRREGGGGGGGGGREQHDCSDTTKEAYDTTFFFDPKTYNWWIRMARVVLLFFFFKV